MDNKTKIQKRQLRNTLERLDKHQFKLFLNIIVHYWANYKFFMSKMNFFHLWCELNELCHETDESFPDQHTDHNLMKDFCIKHPYYFVDILDLGLVKKLFWSHFSFSFQIFYAYGSKLPFIFFSNGAQPPPQ